MRILYSHRIQSRDGQSVHVEEMVAALRQPGHEVLVVGPGFYAASAASAARAGWSPWIRARAAGGRRASWPSWPTTCPPGGGCAAPAGAFRPGPDLRALQPLLPGRRLAGAAHRAAALSWRSTRRSPRNATRFGGLRLRRPGAALERVDVALGHARAGGDRGAASHDRRRRRAAGADRGGAERHRSGALRRPAGAAGRRRTAGAGLRRLRARLARAGCGDRRDGGTNRAGRSCDWWWSATVRRARRWSGRRRRSGSRIACVHRPAAARGDAAGWSPGSTSPCSRGWWLRLAAEDLRLHGGGARDRRAGPAERPRGAARRRTAVLFDPADPGAMWRAIRAAGRRRGVAAAIGRGGARRDRSARLHVAGKRGAGGAVGTGSVIASRAADATRRCCSISTQRSIQLRTPVTHPSSAPPGRPTAGSPPCRTGASASCPPSASPAASACA